MAISDRFWGKVGDEGEIPSRYDHAERVAVQDLSIFGKSVLLGEAFDQVLRYLDGLVSILVISRTE